MEEAGAYEAEPPFCMWGRWGAGEGPLPDSCELHPEGWFQGKSKWPCTETHSGHGMAGQGRQQSRLHSASVCSWGSGDEPHGQ